MCLMYNVTPFKNRVLDLNEPVSVYRNLSKTRKFRYSLRQGRLVVAHANKLALKNCSFFVSEKGRQWVIRNKRKTVHAWVSGLLTPFSSYCRTFLFDVHYNPYECAYFSIEFMGKIFNICAADLVLFTEDGLIASGINLHKK